MGFIDGFKNMAKFNVKYLGGHPDIRPNQVFMESDKENIYFYMGFIKEPKLIIPKSDVVSVTLDRASKRSAGKAAAGAILGGIATGGLGAVAGAAIGGRKKDDSIIVLTVNYNGSPIELFFGGDKVQGKYAMFSKLVH